MKFSKKYKLYSPTTRAHRVVYYLIQASALSDLQLDIDWFIQLIQNWFS